MNRFDITINFDKTGVMQINNSAYDLGDGQFVTGQFDWTNNNIVLLYKMLNREQITHTIAHEVLHSFGLGHCANKKCIMKLGMDKKLNYSLCKKCHTKLNNIIEDKVKPDLPINQPLGWFKRVLTKIHIPF